MDLIAQAHTERTQISARKDALLAEMARIDARLTELDTFIRVAEGYSKDRPTTHASVPQQHNGQIVSDEPAKRGAQKRMIELALRLNSPPGLTNAEIRQWISEHYNGIQVTPNTIGVTLDRLKRAEKARLEGNRWVSQIENAGLTI